MPDPTLWGLFALASVVLLITPGPAVLYIVARSVAQGRRAGLVSVLGIHLGTIFHILAASAGLSALVMSSAVAFAAVKYVGAGYLIWIGIQTLLAKDPAEAGPATPVPSLRRVFRDGFVVNLFNPKTAIFFLAFLPQFIDPTTHTKTLAFLALGATFIASGLAWCLVLAFAAARLQAFFLRNPNARAMIDRVVGLLFVGLGLRLAWSR